MCPETVRSLPDSAQKPMHIKAGHCRAAVRRARVPAGERREDAQCCIRSIRSRMSTTAPGARVAVPCSALAGLVHYSGPLGGAGSVVDCGRKIAPAWELVGTLHVLRGGLGIRWALAPAHTPLWRLQIGPNVLGWSRDRSSPISLHPPPLPLLPFPWLPLLHKPGHCTAAKRTARSGARAPDPGARAVRGGRAQRVRRGCSSRAGQSRVTLAHRGQVDK
ncbi:hypothetical protein NDU88_005472 [Pleurodeles waltl]|uniref:Uncharacterized protein n=1 Tax=Pleurodeles waltl TaxID=8319 RepID=A0AAV7TB41_PLEWA|nr:hypothetical protein NDU88_005472 [Pleurodeles waltl]